MKGAHHVIQCLAGCYAMAIVMRVTFVYMV